MFSGKSQRSVPLRSTVSERKGVYVPEKIDKKFLATLIKRTCSIRVLSLQDRPYTLSDIFELCKALERNSSVRVLNLSGIFIAEEFCEPTLVNQVNACKAIANLLKNNRFIETLILDANHISKMSAKWLAEGLAKSPLRRLSMNVCDFEEGSIFGIMRSLVKSSTLVSFELETSIDLDVVRKSPFTWLDLYEGFSGKLLVDKELRSYFKNLIAERKLIASRVQHIEDEFPVIYVSSPRTVLPKVEEKLGPFSPGWSPRFSPSIGTHSKSKFAEENKKNKVNIVGYRK